jgi:signal transduction histidine kinase
LVIVRKAAQRMGRRTWPDSAPDKGATFFLEWPI